MNKFARYTENMKREALMRSRVSSDNELKEIIILHTHDEVILHVCKNVFQIVVFLTE